MVQEKGPDRRLSRNPYIGSCNRVYEVLNRKRQLSLKMIWRLHKGLGIPAESLIKVSHEATQLTG